MAGDVEVYYQDHRWHVQAKGADHVSSNHDTQHQAVKTARCLATYVALHRLPATRTSIDLIVRDEVGKVVRRTAYPVVPQTGATGGEHHEPHPHLVRMKP